MDEDLSELEAWLEKVTGNGWIWFAKYLAANDTYAKSNVHQGGPYLAQELVRSLFPRLTARAGREKNPDLTINATIDSHGESRDVRVVYYNSRLLGQENGRNEARITRWGGQDSPLVAPDSTGALAVFAFAWSQNQDADGCRIWLCRNPEEENLVLDRIGPVEPGQGLIYSPVAATLPLARPTVDLPCSLRIEEIPNDWKAEFPDGEAIIAETVKRLPSAREMNPGRRLLERRACEYAIFRSVEEMFTLPRILEGFLSVDLFVDLANAVTNRRKSRSGKSLELHARKIFGEEQLPFSHGKQTEGRRTPDFVFPSIEKYHDEAWNADRLRMLAAKTTCKDRWRQILNEADRIEWKHLLTLQEGVSVSQFREMQQSKVILVVPEPLIDSYPESLQSEVLPLGRFIDETRTVCDDA
jgi:hypothetical protein